MPTYGGWKSNAHAPHSREVGNPSGWIAVIFNHCRNGRFRIPALAGMTGVCVFAISQVTLPQILSVAGMPSCFNPPQTKCRLKPDFRRHFRLFPAVAANIDGFLQTRNAVDFQVRKLFGIARHIGFGDDGAFEAEFFRFFEPLLSARDGADFAA